jgi:hypothetical protein
MGNVSFVEKIKRRILWSITFSPESSAVYEIVLENMLRARETTDDNTAHALCLLHK